MTSMSTSEFRKHTAETVNQVAYKGLRIVLKRRDKPVAALIPIEDLELLQALEDAADMKEIRAARKRVAREGTVPWGEVKAGVGL